MDIEVLKELIAQGKSTWQIATELGKSQTTVRYWLKQYDLDTSYGAWQKSEKTSKLCPRCNLHKPLDNFYSRRSEKGTSPYCKLCTTEQTIGRQRNLKRLAVEYKGGKCMKCGYDKCINALEFHHLESDKKEFTISKSKSYRFEKVKPELDKCALLCANCHREVHASNDNITWELQAYPPVSSDNYENPNKANYPSDEELKELVWRYPLSHLAKVFQVSDVAIARYLKGRGIEQPSKGYWGKLTAVSFYKKDNDPDRT